MAESYRWSWRAWRLRLKAMGLASATESYAASEHYTTLASLSDVVWRIRRASFTFGRKPLNAVYCPIRSIVQIG